MDTKREELSKTHGEMMYEFLLAFHEDRPFEIRFVPEIKGLGKSVSVMRDGDFFCIRTQDGFEARAPFTPEGFESYIGLELLLAVGYSAPCFIVNSPNFGNMSSCFSSDQAILNGGSINAQFVDIDAPKEIRYDQELVKQWKLEKANQILAFHIPPSFVIETKHGYHVYWLLKDGSHQLFRHLQMQLIQYFDGDPNCINESRVMRLPGYYHEKDPNKRFPVLLKLWNTNNRYDQLSMKQLLPDLTEETLHRVLKEPKDTLPLKWGVSRRTKILNAIRDKIAYTIDSDKKIITHCCMPDHPDRNPSAWIDTEYMWYHCSGCGTHLPIDELSQALDWQDIIQELERYDIDIEFELAKIQEFKTDVADLLPTQEVNSENLIGRIVSQALNHFESIGQKINSKHRQYINDLVRVLLEGERGKPFLVPLDMGGGKSTIIKFSLLEMLRSNISTGAIVAMERNQAVREFVNEINSTFCEEVAYAMYGFDEEECIWNQRDFKHLKHCVARSHPFYCPYKKQCRYHTQFDDQKSYPIVAITFKRLHIDLENLQEKYRKYEYRGESGLRDKLLIDEKPFMTSVEELKKERFQKYAKQIYNDMISLGVVEAIMQELRGVIWKVHSLCVPSSTREMVFPIDDQFRFSSDFWKVFNKMYHYTQEVYRIPEILESIVRNGGHKTHNSNGDIVIVTSYSKSYTDISDFHTLIFDGTSDADLDYDHEKFHLLNFDSLRTYEGLTFYICDSISASKTSLQNTEKVDALCEDVRKIVHENPNDIVYFPVFKQIEEQVTNHLKQEIDDGKLIVAHYGETRGSNKFRDCSIVVIGGILHKGEDFYIEKARAVFNKEGIQFTDIESSKIGSSRRFNEKLIEQVKILDMLVDYSQEIKRTSQRDNTKNVQGKVFVFHNDKLLLERIGMKFPGCNMTHWAPQTIAESNIKSKSNNHNQQALMRLLREYQDNGELEISYEEIGRRLDIEDVARNKLLNSKAIKSLLTSYHIRPVKEGRSKKLVWD